MLEYLNKLSVRATSAAMMLPAAWMQCGKLRLRAAREPVFRF